MTKKKQPGPLPRAHPIPLAHYHEAVQQYFGWAPSEYELREAWPDGPAYAKRGGNVYQVDNAHDVAERARLLLTRPDEATHIPVSWANALFGDAYLRPEFHALFLDGLAMPRARALAELQTVLAVYHTVKEGPSTFWETVEALDDTALYPAALVAAAQVSADPAALADELTGLLTAEGDDFLNELQGGIFGCVGIDEADETGRSVFYVYSKGADCWDLQAG